MTPTPDRPEAASLDNPLYYLQNFRTVLRWVLAHHADLLSDDERSRLEGFAALPEPSQALLVRMIMRKGERFRLGKLRYPEIGPVEPAFDVLVSAGWIDPEPALSLDELFALLTKPELAEALATPLADAGVKKSANKAAMLAALAETAPPPASLTHWWPDGNERVIALTTMPLFQRLRLMFFGNLRQDWTEFVLTELGHQQYETVPFSPESRAFHARAEVDCYLHLHGCRERLDEGEPPAGILPDISTDALDNPWLESRRGRLLFALARQAERDGDQDLALEAYRRSHHPEARLKRLRLLERRGDETEAWPLLQHALQAPVDAAERQGLERLHKRLARRLGEPAPRSPKPPAIPTLELVLPAQSPVELAVASHLDRSDAPVCYVENTLLNGLFALLCWPALYAPLPGAFFHPFHAAPADLTREDFVTRRRALFDDCLALLDTDAYRARILETWQCKQGTSSPFLYWPILSRELLELSLDCIPARDLRAFFTRMLEDLRAHRAGLPDLIQFRPRASPALAPQVPLSESPRGQPHDAFFEGIVGLCRENATQRTAPWRLAHREPPNSPSPVLPSLKRGPLFPANGVLPRTNWGALRGDLWGKGRASYRLIEVKGPGDRLQDHQKRWLEYCIGHGIEVAVCYVRWQENP